MAVTVLTSIHPLMFTSELCEFAFKAERTETAFRLLDSGGAVLLDTLYSPSLDGTVTVYGLNRILDDAIGDGVAADFTLDIDSVQVVSFKAFKCRVAIESRAQDFLASRFMTSVIGERDTAVGRHECLSVYNPESLPLTVTASYVLEWGKRIKLNLIE